MPPPARRKTSSRIVTGVAEQQSGEGRRDWAAYYAKTQARAPRETVLRALDAFDREEFPAEERLAIDLGCGGGRDLPANLCDQPDLVAIADASGVPMGGDLPPGPDRRHGRGEGGDAAEERRAQEAQLSLGHERRPPARPRPLFGKEGAEAAEAEDELVVRGEQIADLDAMA